MRACIGVLRVWSVGGGLALGILTSHHTSTLTATSCHLQYLSLTSLSVIEIQCDQHIESGLTMSEKDKLDHTYIILLIIKLFTLGEIKT